MEPRNANTLLRNAAVIALGALGLYALLAYLFLGIEWTPLSVPVVLTEGREHAGHFVARWSVPYQVRIDTERISSQREQDCLLGIEPALAEQCGAIGAQLALAWTVEADGRRVASGRAAQTRFGYWGPTIGKILGSFEAVRGQGYRVAVSVGRSAARLQRANPRLEVTVAPGARKWTYVSIGVLAIVATSGALLALVLCAMAGHQLRREGVRRA